MNLRQLYYFKTIAELEHYTRAAEKLYVSQSSLSHAIQEMEAELNVEFFVKRGRNVELTKYGQLFLPYVQKTLETLETGIATLSDYINPNTGTVVMAGFPSLAQFAPNIIVRYVSETNRVDVRLQFNQEATYSQLREQLLAGKVDLIFATKVDDPQVASSYIGEHQLVLLVPLGHRLARHDSADLKELDREDFIAFDSQCQLRSVTDRIFSALNIRPNITMETAQDLIIYGLVAAQHGVSIIPYPLGGVPYNTKVVRIANDIPPRRLYLSWNKEQYLPPAAEYFRDFVIRSGEVFTQFIQNNVPYVV
ncbi:MAG: LysR family transcriptional regulator [Lawsonibacter sp.]|nr:LysR family transcriptional regulator [Lawsonibacter sp.]